jgi:hypothetical protein
VTANGRMSEARAGHRSALAAAALELVAAGHPLIPLHTPRRARSLQLWPPLRQAGQASPRLARTTERQQRSGAGRRLVVGATRREHRPALRRARCLRRRRAERRAFTLDPAGELCELPPTRSQQAGRGSQRFYSIPAGVPIGNSTAPLGSPAEPHLRAGARGYVVAAPSRHANGARYSWRDLETPLAPLPLAWLERLARPKPSVHAVHALKPAPSRGSSPYGRAAMRGELASLAQIEPGGCNNALNRPSSSSPAGYPRASSTLTSCTNGQRRPGSRSGLRTTRSRRRSPRR